MALVLRSLHESDITRVSDIEREAFPTLWPHTNFKRDLANKRICYLVVSADNSTQQATLPSEKVGVPLAKDPMPLKLIRTFRNRFSFHKQPLQAPTNDTPLGFVSVWILSEEAHITAIAVKESWRGHGLGELLLAGAIETAMQRKCRVVTLEVRVSNFSAISLYEKYYFKRVGIRKGYYADNREDAGIMTTEPILSLSYQRKFSELQQTYFKRRGEIDITLSLASA